MTLPQLLKQARVKASLTQEQLANLLGYSRVAIARYEGGQREPSIDDLVKLATLLDIDLNLLKE